MSSKKSREKATPIKGQLTIRVIKGVDIKAGKSIFGDADPYVMMTIGSRTKKTSGTTTTITTTTTIIMIIIITIISMRTRWYEPNME